MVVNSFVQPKNVRVFRVLGICRVSSNLQHASSIAEQERFLKQRLNDLLGEESEKHETRVVAISDSIDTRRATSRWSGSLLKALAKLTAKMRHI